MYLINIEKITLSSIYTHIIILEVCRFLFLHHKFKFIQSKANHTSNWGSKNLKKGRMYSALKNVIDLHL